MEDRSCTARRVSARVFGTFVATGVAAAALLGQAGTAEASGFALKEQSAAALGNAFAGATAGAEDVTYMFFNPAGLTRQEGNQVAAVLSYIIVQGETNNAATNPNVGGEATSGDAADNGLVPAVYGMWSLSPDLKVGIGVNAPFGLSTEYTQTWQGRFDAVESAIEAIDINPAVAYRLSPNLSIGVGLQIQRTEATLSQMSAGGLAEVNGNDWGFGATAGLLYEPSSDTRFGIGYRSQVAHTLKGDMTIGGGFFSDVEADFTAPDIVSFGAYHAYNDKLSVMAEAAWTRWSTFDELRVTNLSGTTLSLTPEDWENVWFFSLGASYRLNDSVTLRGGVAYDQSPVPDATRTPRLTDEDRTWLAIGAQFRPNSSFTIDAGYAHLFIKDSTVNLPDRTPAGPPALTADYENSADILTVQAIFHF